MDGGRLVKRSFAPLAPALESASSILSFLPLIAAGCHKNYLYWGRLCMVPPAAGDTSPTFVADLDYSAEELGDLNENRLDERYDSEFVENLRAKHCSTPVPGAVPAILYTCADADESRFMNQDLAGRRTIVISNGSETLWRKMHGSVWESSGWEEHDPGIDWDCDGVIESRVSGNICDTQVSGSWLPEHDHQDLF